MTKQDLLDSEHYNWIETVNDDKTVVTCFYCKGPMQLCKNTLNLHAGSPGHKNNYLSVTNKKKEVNKIELETTDSHLNTNDSSFNPPHDNVVGNVMNVTEPKKPSEGKFLTNWLKSEKFSMWLEAVADDQSKAHCEVCNLNLRAQSSVLTEHIKCHSVNRQGEIVKKSKKIDIEAIKIKLKIAAQAVHTNMAYLNAENQLSFYQGLATDSEILKKGSMDLTLEGDENASANGITLSNIILKSFEKHEIPLTNIVGIITDGASVMTGVRKSVVAFLKEKIPNFMPIKCFCHIEHLCAMRAAQKIPGHDAFGIIVNYVRLSPTKNHSFEVLQERMDLNVLQVLKNCPTRWLSNYSVINRCLQRWMSLTIFFENEYQKDNENTFPDDTIKELRNFFRDPVQQAYVMFMEVLIGKLAEANLILQAEKPTFGKDHTVMKELYINLLKMYILDTYVEQCVADGQLHKIDPKDTTKFKPSKEIRIGWKTRLFLENSQISEKEQKIFLENCLESMQEATVQMSQRCKFDDDKLSSLSLFHPENALDEKFHERANSDSLLFIAFQRFESLLPDHGKMKDVMYNEWDNLLTSEIPDNIKNERDIDKFWFLLKEVHDGRFRYLSEFVLNLLCIPNSNAASERVWSKYKLEKPDIRSSLHNESIRSIMLARSLIKDVGGVKNLKILDEMIYSLHDTSGNLRNKKKPRNEAITSTFGYVNLDPGSLAIAKVQAELYHFKFSEENESHRAHFTVSDFQHKSELLCKDGDAQLSDCDLDNMSENSVCSTQSTQISNNFGSGNVSESSTYEFKGSKKIRIEKNNPRKRHQPKKIYSHSSFEKKTNFDSTIAQENIPLLQDKNKIINQEDFQIISDLKTQLLPASPAGTFETTITNSSSSYSRRPVLSEKSIKLNSRQNPELNLLVPLQTQRNNNAPWDKMDLNNSVDIELCSNFYIGGIYVTPDNLVSLKYGAMIDDVIIDGFFQLTKHLFGTNQVLLFSAQFFVALLAAPEGKMPQSWLKWAMKTEARRYKIWLIPKCVGLHWTLIVVIFPLEIIIHFDSRYGPSSVEKFRTVSKKFDIGNVRLCRFINTVMPNISSFDKWKIHYPKDVPSQLKGNGGTNNCGAHICLWAYLILSGNHNVFDENSMPKARKLILCTLIEAKGQVPIIDYYGYGNVPIDKNDSTLKLDKTSVSTTSPKIHKSDVNTFVFCANLVKNLKE
ncbi:hypothetical protein TKK_0018569 [Trichogramma kaykai]